MRASSPRLVAVAAALVCFVMVAVPGTAEPIQITIHASSERAMDHPATAEVSVDVAAVRAAADAYAARRLPDGVVSAPAALDAARAAGLEEGVAPWRAVLAFSSSHATIVWRVANTTRADTGISEGRRMTLDAASGEVLGRERWHAIVG